MNLCNYDLKTIKKTVFLSIALTFVFFITFNFIKQPSVTGDITENIPVEIIIKEKKLKSNSTIKIAERLLEITYTKRPIIKTSNHPSKTVKKIKTEKARFRENLFQKQQKKIDYSPKPTKDFLSTPPLIKASRNTFVVNCSGSFLERLASFNEKVSKVRKVLLKIRGSSLWENVEQPERLKVIWGNTDTFFEELQEVFPFKLVVLPWMPGPVSSNVLYEKYYKWTGSDQLCSWIETVGFTKAKWDAVYNRTCHRNASLAQKHSPLETMYLYGKPINPRHYWPNNGLSYPPFFFTRPPPYSLYLTIIQDAVVNLNGDVIAGEYKVVPYTCSHDSIPTVPSETMQTPIYTEVFVITQFWGTAYFHRIVEVLPRMAPYVDFLKSHPSIFIHASEELGMTARLVEALGVAKGRLVTGTVRAKILYLPQGTPCGFSHLASTQVFSHILRQQIHPDLPASNSQVVENIKKAREEEFSKLDLYPSQAIKTTLIPSTPLEHTSSTIQQNKLLLVHRSGTRKFLHREQIAKVLSEFSEKRHLDFEVFRDDPVPDLHSTMLMFHSARVIVAPHGAGLANCIFAQPGTLVIEGVCNPPHVNMCFQFFSYQLGLRYHGIASMHGCEGFIDVTPEQIVGALQLYTRVWADVRENY